MPITDFRNALAISVQDLGRDLTRCFEGYVVPIEFSPALMGSIARTDGVDLEETLLAYEEGIVQGILLVCRRGSTTRIGAMAIAKERRGQGLGTELMARAVANARGRNDTKVVLEAIEQNVRAVAFYESFGFKKRFRLVGATIALPKGTTSEAMRWVTLEEIAFAVSTRGVAASAWPMSGPTVAQMASPTVGVAVEDLMAAIAPIAHDKLLLRSVALTGNEDGRKLRLLLDALGATYPGRTLRIPPYFPEPEFKEGLEATGLEIDSLTQFHFELVL